MPLFAVTIFCGAFLLFQLQPLMGKFLLPWFGGGPGVWTSCLLFFQGLLLAGYAYAHWLSTLRSLRRQAVVHGVLLVVSLAFLPIRPSETWQPHGTDDPLTLLLLTLISTVGLPYFVLSATGPLLQRWASLGLPALAGKPTGSPYRLYALSNAGSLLALLSFPFVFEPLASRTTLSLGWSAGLVVFVALCGACAWRLYQAGDVSDVAGVARPELVEGADPGPSNPGSATPATTPAPEPQTRFLDRLFWVALPAGASVLLVAMTNKMCLDIAAVPFLWVLPLAVYLLTFILCFDHPRWYSRRWNSALLVGGSLATARCLSDTTLPLPVQVGVYVVTLFGGCMVAHGELYRLRPAPRRLTGFYLAIAAGGAGGSAFVGLLAPRLFSDYHELQLGLMLLIYLAGAISLVHRSRSLAVGPAIGLLAGAFLVPALQVQTGVGLASWLGLWAAALVHFFTGYAWAIGAVLLIIVTALRRGWRAGSGEWRWQMSVLPLLLSPLFGVLFVVQARRANDTTVASARNFYGAHKLHLYHPDEPHNRFLLLSHGGTTHGLQFSHADFHEWPTTYYAVTSGAGRILDDGTAHARRIGLVGLGAGSLAVYGRAGDLMRFYEIDPAIIDLAQHQFTYLKDFPGRKEIVPGDARLSLEDEWRRGGSQRFDVLVLDAFSGDAIPIHLLTREAMALYLRHLRPGGVIAVHISNRHLDLRPVVAGLARHSGLHFASIRDTVDPQDWWLYNSTWMLLSADPARLTPEQLKAMAEDPSDALLPTVDWTDDHASLFSVLKRR